MTLIPVSLIAKYVIANSPEISNLKLQKILYYVQGWHLGIYDDPVFNEEIQAWVHGPVVPKMFHEYKKFGWNTIEKPSCAPDLDTRIKSHIDKVLRAYGGFTASQLERISHTESPWIEARKGLEPHIASTSPIPHDAMRSYFGDKAKG